MVDPIARAFAGCIGERRKPSHKATVRLVVSVEVQWPEGIPFDENKAANVARCVVHPSVERDVGPTGKIVWAKCVATIDDEHGVVSVDGPARD